MLNLKREIEDRLGCPAILATMAGPQGDEPIEPVHRPSSWLSEAARSVAA